MFLRRAVAIYVVCVALLPALTALEPTPLQRQIASIRELQEQSKLPGARSACDAALPLAEHPAATLPERATLFSICGSLWYSAGELAKSRTLLERALSLWEETLGATHPQVGTTSLDLALVYRLTGRYEL